MSLRACCTISVMACQLHLCSVGQEGVSEQRYEVITEIEPFDGLKSLGEEVVLVTGSIIEHEPVLLSSGYPLRTTVLVDRVISGPANMNGKKLPRPFVKAAVSRFSDSPFQIADFRRLKPGDRLLWKVNASTLEVIDCYPLAFESKFLAEARFNDLRLALREKSKLEETRSAIEFQLEKLLSEEKKLYWVEMKEYGPRLFPDLAVALELFLDSRRNSRGGSEPLGKWFYEAIRSERYSIAAKAALLSSAIASDPSLASNEATLLALFELGSRGEGSQDAIALACLIHSLSTKKVDDAKTIRGILSAVDSSLLADWQRKEFRLGFVKLLSLDLENETIRRGILNAFLGCLEAESTTDGPNAHVRPSSDCVGDWLAYSIVSVRWNSSEQQLIRDQLATFPISTRRKLETVLK